MSKQAGQEAGATRDSGSHPAGGGPPPPAAAPWGATAAGRRAGFVALAGRPNVGKSTLLNALLGDKLAIVSAKPQTTRRPLRGILHFPEAQLVLVDTPGLAARQGALGRALWQSACQSVLAADVTLVVASAAEGVSPSSLGVLDGEVLEVAQQARHPVVLALNKIDRIRQKDQLLPQMAAWARAHAFRAIVPISARTQDGLPDLLEEIVACLPEGPALYPEDMHTDALERRLCEELVFEQLLRHLRQEVPHRSVVVMEAFEDRRDAGRPLCRLQARIFVERETHKGIVIGRGAAMLKAIGQGARAQIEALLGCQVFLHLTVGVAERWTEREQMLREWGLVGEVAR